MGERAWVGGGVVVEGGWNAKTEHTTMIMLHLGANDGFEKCVFLQISKQR